MISSSEQQNKPDTKTAIPPINVVLGLSTISGEIDSESSSVNSRTAKDRLITISERSGLFKLYRTIRNPDSVRNTFGLLWVNPMAMAKTSPTMNQKLSLDGARCSMYLESASRPRSRRRVY
jgi:hypothetical protein